MNNIKEINRRSMYHEEEGTACGPYSLTAIDAEIALDIDGQNIFLHAQWVDAAGDDILYEATTESIYEVYEKMNRITDDDEMQAAVAEQERIEATRLEDDSAFEPYYKELKQMIIDEMEENGIYDYFDDEYEFDLPEDLDRESLYRMRLFLETDIETESISHDMESGILEEEEAKLEAVLERCDDEDDYQSWKDAFIDSEYEKIKDKQFLVCQYLFAGIGQYEAIIPKDQKEAFVCWINGNGSAFFGGEREATESDVKKYIALHADSEMK